MIVNAFLPSIVFPSLYPRNRNERNQIAKILNIYFYFINIELFALVILFTCFDSSESHNQITHPLISKFDVRYTFFFQNLLHQQKVPKIELTYFQLKLLFFFVMFSATTNLLNKLHKNLIYERFSNSNIHSLANTILLWSALFYRSYCLTSFFFSFDNEINICLCIINPCIIGSFLSTSFLYQLQKNRESTSTFLPWVNMFEWHIYFIILQEIIYFLCYLF